MLVVGAVAAHAFELRLDPEGEPARWRAFPVSVSVSAGDPDAATLNAAFAVWGDADGSRARFRAEAPVARPRVSPDDVNVVYFDPAWPWGEALAMTSAWMTEDGEIVAFDIQIDPRAEWSTDGDGDGFDLEAAVVHELGHALGIEHSAVPEATMYASHGRGETWRRELHEDDVAAVSFLYPDRSPTDPGAASADEEEPEGPLAAWFSGSAHCGHAPGAWPAAVLALSLVRRRARQEVRR